MTYWDVKILVDNYFLILHVKIMMDNANISHDPLSQRIEEDYPHVALSCNWNSTYIGILHFIITAANIPVATILKDLFNFHTRRSFPKPRCQNSGVFKHFFFVLHTYDISLKICTLSFLQN